jgi:hypothetical protein
MPAQGYTWRGDPGPWEEMALVPGAMILLHKVGTFPAQCGVRSILRVNGGVLHAWYANMNRALVSGPDRKERPGKQYLVMLLWPEHAT